MSDGSAVCGGVISESFLKKQTDPYGYMMAMVMPDKEFEEYKKLVEAGKNEEATKLFDKHAWSQV